MGIVLAPIESTPYIGGTSTGLVYVDGSGNQKTDGPTWASSTLTVAGNTRIANGLTATPSYSFTSSTSTGMNWDGANLAFIRSGTQGLIVQAATVLVNSGSIRLVSDAYLVRKATGTVGVFSDNGTTLGTLQTGLLTATAPTATDVPVSITGAAAQSANYFEIGANGGTAGDVFKVDSANDATFAGDRSSAASDATGKHTTTKSEEVHTLAAAGTSDTTTISIPSGARLLGVSFNVNTAITGCTSWSAAFVTGSTTALATTAALTLDTKVDTMLADEITSGIAEVRFTAVGGGASFTAGAIEVVAYYETLTSLANA